MKLDVNALRYLSKDEFRVLTAVEMGMRNVSRWREGRESKVLFCDDSSERNVSRGQRKKERKKERKSNGCMQ